MARKRLLAFASALRFVGSACCAEKNALTPGRRQFISIQDRVAASM
jgi:hypothetical protein